MSEIYPALRQHLADEEPVVLATVIEGPNTGAKLMATGPEAVSGSLGDDDLDRVVTRDALGELAAGRTGVRSYGVHGEAREDGVRVFIETFAPPPKMVIFGAVDFTAALARAGKLLGFRVTVADAREVFATPRRFPMADEVLVEWPNRVLERLGPSLGPADAICVLTHDNKFDVPALMSAVETKVGYIGAMGSRRTSDNRDTRLREEGMTEDQLARIMAPIGLDIGSRTPEETAISICAEIIARRTGKLAPSLRDGSGPIHA